MVKQAKWFSVGGLIVLVFISVGNPTHAEFYVGGQAGAHVSNTLGGVETTGGPAGVVLNDLELRNFVVFGAKAGYFLPQVPNLGFEISASHAKPDIESQSTVVSGPIPGIGSFERTSLRVVTVAFNLVARARMKGFEPYAGIGVGLFFARLKDQTGASSSDNGVPGFNALAGYRSFLTDDRRLALAVEYTYQRAQLNFSNVFDSSLGLGTGLGGTYEAHAMTVGMSYHFH